MVRQKRPGRPGQARVAYSVQLVAAFMTIACCGCGRGDTPRNTGTAATTTPEKQVLSAGPLVAKEWYVPVEGDFRPEYDRDTANQAKQPWEQYWGWVKTFYQGNLLARGWTAQGEELAAVLKSEAGRDELRGALNALGRRIVAEWAKDNEVRKISTADVRTFADRLQEAKRADDGSGEALRKAVDEVRAVVDARIGAR
jgi:hypothetical protein